jgi:putative transposase
MKRKRYTEPQFVFALQRAESGTAVAEICRKMGVAEATFYRWNKHPLQPTRMRVPSISS